jgi:hypothetical protein
MSLGLLRSGHDFVIETSWSPDVATVELAKQIEGACTRRGGDEPFVGHCEDQKAFRFSRRKVPLDKSTRLVVVATVEPSHRGGARVRVRVRFPTVVLVLPVLFLLAVFAQASKPSKAGSSAESLLPFALVVLLVALAGAGAAIGVFWAECRKVEQELRWIFTRAPALPPPYESGEPYR